MSASLITAFDEFRSALLAKLPTVVDELRSPVSYSADFLDQPGSEQLRTLWSITSGQPEGTLGIAGGLLLLGPVESQLELEKWRTLMTLGTGLAAVAKPGLDTSRSLDPSWVREVYFAAGWIPVLREPLEANYLAVDLVPLPAGRAGQIVLCGRDEDEKCVVAPDLAFLFRALAADCRYGAWRLCTGKPKHSSFRYIERHGGRLLTACRKRQFPLSSVRDFAHPSGENVWGVA